MELHRRLSKLTTSINEAALAEKLKEVAEISNTEISRRERERLMVRTAVTHLPQNMRLILFLKFWEGELLEEIAKMLALPMDEVRFEYVTGLSYLEKVLKPYVLQTSFFTKERSSAV